MAELKNEFQVEKNEPKLQPKAARPNELAVIRSVSNGALNAIADANKPTRLKRIKSMKILGSGKSNLRIRWESKKKMAKPFKIEYLFQVRIIEF